MEEPEYVSLRDFYVLKISKKAARLRPHGVGDRLDGWVPFSLFDEISLARVVRASTNRSQLSNIRIERWKAEKLGWVKPEKELELVE